MDGLDPKGSYHLTPFVKRPGGFYNRKTSEPFTNLNQIGYGIDPYERKEDLARDEYARLNSKILYKNQPFSQVVKQKGTFYPNVMTYGTTKEFPQKQATPRFVPKYGVFKPGDVAHVGHNKTFGGGQKSSEYSYLEECEKDKVKYQRDVRNPIWRTTNQMSKSMVNASIITNARNVNTEKQFAKL